VDDTNHTLAVCVMPDINPSINRETLKIPSQTHSGQIRKDGSDDCADDFLDYYEVFIGNEQVDTLSWQTMNFHFQGFEHQKASEDLKSK
jgi:hypothetical protein